jgi:flagellar protein FlgJ
MERCRYCGKPVGKKIFWYHLDSHPEGSLKYYCFDGKSTVEVLPLTKRLYLKNYFTMVVLLLAFNLQAQPECFINTYYTTAVEVGNRYGIAPEIILTQAALESSWGRRAVGNNFFGIKGPGQLCKTTEYHKVTTKKYPHIFSITETRLGYKYVILDHFRCYDTAYDSFADFALVAKRLGKYHCNPIKYYKSLSTYATHPGYSTLLIKVHRMVVKEIKRQCLA